MTDIIFVLIQQVLIQYIYIYIYIHMYMSLYMYMISYNTISYRIIIIHPNAKANLTSWNDPPEAYPGLSGYNQQDPWNWWFNQDLCWIFMDSWCLLYPNTSKGLLLQHLQNA